MKIITSGKLGDSAVSAGAIWTLFVENFLPGVRFWTNLDQICWMSWLRLATPFRPEWRWQLMKVIDVSTKSNLIYTAPLLPIIFLNPVAMKSVSMLEMSGLNLFVEKITKCVACRQTEPIMTYRSPRHSWIIWFMISLLGENMLPTIDLSASCVPITKISW